MTGIPEPIRLEQAEIDLYRTYIGRSEIAAQRLDLESLRRFAVVVGSDLDGAIPPLGHWAFFLPAVPPDRIGSDGHPLRGGFLPPIRLPRRMFAGAKLRFPAAIEPDAPASLTASIADVKHRSGKAGDLVFVEVDQVLTQHGITRVEERQTIAYLNIAGRVPEIVATERQPATDAVAERQWVPGEIDLFRFSAVTFNAHRIHYDRRYTCDVELYPDLVVHGPFTAAKLCGLATELAGGPLISFEFRANAPLFVGQEISLVARREDDRLALEAVRCDGIVAMTATATH